MAYPITDASVLEIRLVGKLFGQTCINTLHYSPEAGSVTDGRAEIVKFLIDWEDGYWNVLRTALSQDYNNVTIYGQLVETTRYQPVARKPIIANGLVGTAALPPSVAVITRKYGERAGRRFQGRSFWAGLPVGAALNGALTDAGFDVWSETIAPLQYLSFAAGTDLIWKPVIYGKGPPVSATTVIDGTADKVLRSQRRRELGVGI